MKKIILLGLVFLLVVGFAYSIIESFESIDSKPLIYYSAGSQYFNLSLPRYSTIINAYLDLNYYINIEIEDIFTWFNISGFTSASIAYLSNIENNGSNIFFLINEFVIGDAEVIVVNESNEVIRWWNFSDNLDFKAGSEECCGVRNSILFNGSDMWLYENPTPHGFLYKTDYPTNPIDNTTTFTIGNYDSVRWNNSELWGCNVTSLTKMDSSFSPVQVLDFDTSLGILCEGFDVSSDRIWVAARGSDAATRLFYVFNQSLGMLKNYTVSELFTGASSDYPYDLTIMDNKIYFLAATGGEYEYSAIAVSNVTGTTSNISIKIDNIKVYENLTKLINSMNDINLNNASALQDCIDTGATIINNKAICTINISSATAGGINYTYNITYYPYRMFYTDPAIETSIEPYALRFNYNSTFNYTATLILNNTAHTPTRTIDLVNNFTSFNISLYVPEPDNLSTTVQLYWNYSKVFNTTKIENYTTATENQTIYQLLIDSCDSNDTTQVVLTFFSIDEETNLTVDDIDLDITFEVWNSV